jgi:hypothetical protein
VKPQKPEKKSEKEKEKQVDHTVKMVRQTLPNSLSYR